MLRAVLLAYDGSDAAEEALPLSIALAQGLQAELHIVAVLEASRAQTAAVFEADRRHAWQQLRDAEDMALRAGVRARLDVLEGDPADQILDQARQDETDIIVLGHSRHGRLARLAGRGVEDVVLKHARCAVLLPAVWPSATAA